jgi:hypothetical protein
VKKDKPNITTANERIAGANSAGVHQIPQSATKENKNCKYLMNCLKIDTVKKVIKLKKIHPNNSRLRMFVLIHNIFSSASSDEDDNYFGKINIVALQCSILFTENCIGLEPCPSLNNSINILYDSLTSPPRSWESVKWTNYNYVREQLKKNHEFKELYHGIIKHSYEDDDNESVSIFRLLSIIYGVVSREKIIKFLLQNVGLCGTASDVLYADKLKLVPFEFILHDYLHAKGTIMKCYHMWGRKSEDFLSFCDFCKKRYGERENKEKLNSIMLIFFYIIHEGDCSVSPNFHLESVITEETVNNEIVKQRYHYMQDLGGEIPKTHRTNKRKINEYLNCAIKNYVDCIREWRSSKQSTENDVQQQVLSARAGGKFVYESKARKSKRKAKKPNNKTRGK